MAELEMYLKIKEAEGQLAVILNKIKEGQQIGSKNIQTYKMLSIQLQHRMLQYDRSLHIRKESERIRQERRLVKLAQQPPPQPGRVSKPKNMSMEMRKLKAQLALLQRKEANQVLEGSEGEPDNDLIQKGVKGIQTHPKAEKVNCPKCKRLIKREYLEMHLDICDPSVRYPCCFCELTYKSELCLKRHVKKKHQQTSINAASAVSLEIDDSQKDVAPSGEQQSDNENKENGTAPDLAHILTFERFKSGNFEIQDEVS